MLKKKKDPHAREGDEKIPWRRKWQPTPVFLPGEVHGQRSLIGYSPWGHRGVRCNLVTKQVIISFCGHSFQRKTTRHKAFPDGSAHHLGSILAKKPQPSI